MYSENVKAIIVAQDVLPSGYLLSDCLQLTGQLC